MTPAKSDATLLEDMLDASREAVQFVAGVDFEAFLADRMLSRAVERCLEIVGEAASRVSPQTRKAHPEVPWHELRGLRNILAHEYGEIMEEVIYRSVKVDAPVLIGILEAIASGQGGGPREPHVFYAREVR